MELNDTYVGIVMDVNDELKIGRCRVMIDMLFKDIKTEELPWAYPTYPTIFGKSGQCGAISVPKVGSVVRVKFINGDLYQPVYECIHELADDVKSELNNEYEGTHVLLYDGDDGLKIYYTKNRGLTLELKDSSVNIGSDSAITINHKESRSTITLNGPTVTIESQSEIQNKASSLAKTTSETVWENGKTSTKLGPKPVYSGVRGEPLMFVLQALAASIDAKMYETPGVNAALIEGFRNSVLSDNVKLS